MPHAACLKLKDAHQINDRCVMAFKRCKSIHLTIEVGGSRNLGFVLTILTFEKYSKISKTLLKICKILLVTGTEWVKVSKK
jgi:hypothetical protein